MPSSSCLRPKAQVPCLPAPVLLGPYADVFVGGRAVLVLGCGSGRFMDSLGLRDVPCQGFELDPALYAKAKARGHRVHALGPEGLRDFPATFDGIYLGRAGDPLRGQALSRLFGLVAFSLQPGGCFLLRRPKESLVWDSPDQLRAWAEAAGLGSIQIAAVQGDPEDFFLFAEKRKSPMGDTHLLPLLCNGASLDGQIHSSAAPIERPLHSLFDLERFERRKWSQGGEDGLLATLFDVIGPTNRFLVEFGCGDGSQCNGAALIRDGWQGLMMDGQVPPRQSDLLIQKEWISAETIVPLFKKYDVPKRFDLLSLDIDGNDYWVWKAIPHRPRVVIIEYNGNLPPNPSVTIPYDPHFCWRGGDHYGASLGALAKLGEQKGYRLVYCTQAGVNAVFVDKSLIPPGPHPSLEEIYRPANYFYGGVQQLHDPEGVWVSV